MVKKDYLVKKDHPSLFGPINLIWVDGWFQANRYKQLQSPVKFIQLKMIGFPTGLSQNNYALIAHFFGEILKFWIFFGGVSQVFFIVIF
jgi:hypothetical protein